MAHRCLTSPGTPDLWTRFGWLQGSTRNGMKWSALTLPEITHSRGCYLKFAVLLVQRVCSPRRSNTKDPRLCALVAYIAGDTSCHQPMGAGHMTVLQLHGPMGFHVLQWCHPMLACVKRTSYCTRIITLYGARKVDSGPHTYFFRAGGACPLGTPRIRYCHQAFNLIVKLLAGWGVHPFLPKMSPISCIFLENLAKLDVGNPEGRPLSYRFNPESASARASLFLSGNSGPLMIQCISKLYITS